MQQPSFLALAHEKKLKCERFLDEMNKIIPWENFIAEIKPFYEAKELGRTKTNLKMLLKIYFLQQWYALSDPGAEEAIYDRNSFQKFLDIDLLADRVPDESTILHFRHLLEKHELQKKFFEVVQKLLEQKGLIMREGTILDATIIAAPSSTKNKEKKRDPEMSSTKKHNDWFFGMKAHIGVDSQSGLIHSLDGTTAKIHDKDVALFHGQEKAKFGDKGYFKTEDKKQARTQGIFWGVLDKGKRGHALSSSQKKRNRKLSSVRAKVEHPFQVLKCQWKYTKVRYRGLQKNTLQLFTLFSLVNLFKVRKKLMA